MLNLVKIRKAQTHHLFLDPFFAWQVSTELLRHDSNIYLSGSLL